MWTFTITDNGRIVENLDDGPFPTRELAEEAAQDAMDSCCPPLDPMRKFYRYTVHHAPMYVVSPANASALYYALDDMLPLALAYLQERAAKMTAEDDDDEDGLPAKWELAQRYRAAKAALKACQ
jgi:hypothetical protein